MFCSAHPSSFRPFWQVLIWEEGIKSVPKTEQLCAIFVPFASHVVYVLCERMVVEFFTSEWRRVGQTRDRTPQNLTPIMFSLREPLSSLSLPPSPFHPFLHLQSHEISCHRLKKSVCYKSLLVVPPFASVGADDDDDSIQIAGSPSIIFFSAGVKSAGL